MSDSPTTSTNGDRPPSDARPEAATGAGPMVLLPMSRVLASAPPYALVPALLAGLVGLAAGDRPALSALAGLLAGLLGTAGALIALQAWKPRPLSRWPALLFAMQAVSAFSVALLAFVLYSASPVRLQPVPVALASAGVFIGLQISVARVFGTAVGQQQPPSRG